MKTRQVFVELKGYLDSVVLEMGVTEEEFAFLQDLNRQFNDAARCVNCQPKFRVFDVGKVVMR